MNFYDLNEIKQAGNCIRFVEECLGIEVKNNRCAAVWRGGDGQNVHVTEETWYDHVEKVGGGIIDLCGVTKFPEDKLPKEIMRIQDYLGEWLHLKPKLLMRPSPTARQSRYDELIADGYNEVKRYLYRDLDGTVRHFVARMEHPEKPKEFVQGTPSGWGTKGVSLILYRLKDWKDKPGVFIVEGEKDADTLNDIGIPATTNCQGAGKWDPEYNAEFIGKHVVIIRDNDEAGEKHAIKVAGQLLGKAASVKILCPSSLPKGDVTDWIQKEGGTPERLIELVKAAEPINPDAIKAMEPKQDPAKELRQRFGPMLIREMKDKEGNVYNGWPNESYFAGLFTMENHILWDPDERVYYLYDPEQGLWVSRAQESIHQEISSLILKTSRVHKYPFLAEKRSASTLRNIDAQLKGIAERRHAFKRTHKLIPCKNGCVEIASGALLPHSPEHYFRNGLPIEYNPDAKCPEFLDGLLNRAVSQDDAQLIQRWFGMAILQKNIAQRILVLDGSAGQGKSQLVSIARQLVGRLNSAELRTNLLLDRFEMFMIRHASLLIGSDVTGDFLEKKGASRLKAMTGGDTLAAEGKNLNTPLQITGDFNCVVTSNERLRVKLDGDAGAWRRRLLIVRFESPPPSRVIENYADHLFAKEGAGILNWAIRGARMLLDDMDSGKGFTTTTAQARRVDDLLAESDSLRTFLKEKVRRGMNALPKEAIISSYFRYCELQGWKAGPLPSVQKTLPHLMLELFSVSQARSVEYGGKQVQGFRGVDWNSVEIDE